MKHRVESSVRAGFILVCGLLAGMAVTAYFSVRHAQDTIAWSRHTHEVMTQIPVTLSAFQDIEVGMSGYLLTGDEAFLEPYQRALSKAALDFQRLKEMTSDNPLQQERIGELQPAIDRKLTIARELIKLRGQRGYSTERVQQELVDSKQAMDQIRAILAAMASGEAQLQAQRRDAFDDATRRMLWALSILAEVMFVLFVISYVMLERHLLGRHRAEAALRESENRVRLLLDSASEAICGVDGDGLCTFANLTLLKKLGYSDLKLLLGKNLHELSHHTRRDGTPYPASECPLLQVVKKGLPVHLPEELVWRADGSSFPAEFWAYPVHGDGEITGAVVTFLDISERKGVEQALQEANLKLAGEISEADLRTSQVTLIGEMAAMLQSSTSWPEAYQVIGQAAARLFPGTSGAVGIIAHSRDAVEIVTQWGEPALREQDFPPEDCWALRTGRPYLAESQQGKAMCNHVLPEKCTASFCVPMMALAESLGVLFLSQQDVAQTGGSLSAQAPLQSIMIAFAESVSLALANLQLRETLRMQSIRDPLTGLFNRRYMEECLNREIKRAARSGRPISVIIFDVDHFKRYNDTFGHDAGDALLKEASSLFQTLVRGGDVACRYGGEEFLLLMPDSPARIASQRAENLRNSIAGLHVEHNGQALGAVTISAGVASFPENGSTSAAVIRAADQALYRAKESGRNRVMAAESVLSE